MNDILKLNSIAINALSIHILLN